MLLAQELHSHYLFQEKDKNLVVEGISETITLLCQLGLQRGRIIERSKRVIPQFDEEQAIIIYKVLIYNKRLFEF